MNTLASLLSRSLPCSLLLSGLFFSGSGAWAQVPLASSFTGGGTAPPVTAVLPDAPVPAAPSASSPAIVRAALPPADRPLVLPRNFMITPGASRSHMPGKISYYLGSTVSFRNLVEAMLLTGIPNLTTAPTQPDAPPDFSVANAQVYEQSMENYGNQMDVWRRVNQATLRFKAGRFETGLATAETRQLFSNLVLPLALHQRAEYIPAPVHSDFGQRMMHAALSVVVTENDRGQLVPNYSKVGGTVLAAFAGKSVYASAFKVPELDSSHFFTRYIGYSLLGDLATNTGHELVRAALEPDMAMFGLHGRATDDSYYPLSLGGKTVYWLRSTYAPRNFVEAGLIGGLPRITDVPVEPTPGRIENGQEALNYDQLYLQYGTDVQTWRRDLENGVRYHEHRFIGGLGESETQMFLQNFAIPVLFNMDPRYVPLGAGYTGSQRLGHALRGLLETHTDAGNRTINLPVLAGTVGAAFAARELYYPQLGTPSLESNGVLVKTVGLNLLADGMYNIIGEFWRHRGY